MPEKKKKRRKKKLKKMLKNMEEFQIKWNKTVDKKS